MPEKKNLSGLLPVLVAVFCVTCSVRSADEHAQQQPPPKPELGSDSKTLSPSLSTPPSDTTSLIRKIDFGNFTYPYGSLSESPSFTLKDGSRPVKRDGEGIILERAADLGGATYGDLTGDSVEEAVVTISFLSGGSWLPHNVYVYTLQHGKPHLLWLIETGDRADRGLKQVDIDNGELVLELYSPEDSKGACCPTKFTRTRYTWDSKENKFHKKGQDELLPLNK